MKIVIGEVDVMLHNDEKDVDDRESYLGSSRLLKIRAFAERKPGIYDVHAIESPNGAWTLRRGRLSSYRVACNNLYFNDTFVETLCGTAVRLLGLETGKTYVLMMTRIGD